MFEPITVFAGKHEFNLLPHVHEAIAALGYIEPGAALWLAQGIKAHWLDGSSGRYLRCEGKEITKDRKRELNLGHARMTEEAWAALTDKGKANPVHGFDITCSRIVHAVYRAKAQAEIARHAKATPRMFVAVHVMVSPSDPCTAVAAIADRYYSPDDFPGFPLPACDSEACGCNWRQCTKHEVGNTPIASWKG